MQSQRRHHDPVSPTGDRRSGPWRAIGRSWLSLKTWVKLWLFALNALFLAAFYFLPHPAAVWSLVAYFASGPLLLLVAYRQGGLTRLLGIAHLVPWSPLLVYLGAWLLIEPGVSGAQREPALYAYVWALFVTIAICLALDWHDLMRWLRGERHVLGSSEDPMLECNGSGR